MFIVWGNNKEICDHFFNTEYSKIFMYFYEKCKHQILNAK